MSLNDKDQTLGPQNMSLESDDHSNESEGGVSKPAPIFQLKSDGASETDKALNHMSNAFGTDLSNVNIHAESDKASDVGALAYTQGNDIHFAPGQYNPSSSSGMELLGHEMAHVVQQREGRVQANNEVNGMPLNDDKGLETEADVLGAKAANMSFDHN